MRRCTVPLCSPIAEAHCSIIGGALRRAAAGLAAALATASPSSCGGSGGTGLDIFGAMAAKRTAGTFGQPVGQWFASANSGCNISTVFSESPPTDSKLLCAMPQLNPQKRDLLRGYCPKNPFYIHRFGDPNFHFQGFHPKPSQNCFLQVHLPLEISHIFWFVFEGLFLQVHFTLEVSLWPVHLPWHLFHF